MGLWHHSSARDDEHQAVFLHFPTTVPLKELPCIWSANSTWDLARFLEIADPALCTHDEAKAAALSNTSFEIPHNILPSHRDMDLRSDMSHQRYHMSASPDLTGDRQWPDLFPMDSVGVDYQSQGEPQVNSVQHQEMYATTVPQVQAIPAVHQSAHPSGDLSSLDSPFNPFFTSLPQLNTTPSNVVDNWGSFGSYTSMATDYIAQSSPSSTGLSDWHQFSPARAIFGDELPPNFKYEAPTSDPYATRAAPSYPQPMHGMPTWPVGTIPEGVSIRRQEKLPQDAQTLSILPTPSGDVQLPYRRADGYGVPVSDHSSSDGSWSRLAIESSVTPHGSDYLSDGGCPSTSADAEEQSYRNKRPVSQTKTQERMEQDELLLAMKAAGASYKRIKKVGKFAEAESTLRGRYRTLTKDKHLRVRKPDWKTQDMHLLRAAVLFNTGKTDDLSDDQLRATIDANKVPWKKVSEYMKVHGSSYEFGYATCKKKWIERYGS